MLASKHGDSHEDQHEPFAAGPRQRDAGPVSKPIALPLLANSASDTACLGDHLERQDLDRSTRNAAAGQGAAPMGLVPQISIIRTKDNVPRRNGDLTYRFAPALPSTAIPTPQAQN